MSPMDFANDLIKTYDLPHFFRVKLRADAKRASAIKDDTLPIYAEIYKDAVILAKTLRFNVENVHKMSELTPESQKALFPTAVKVTGHLPNPRWLNALEYAAYKTHRKQVKLLKA